MRSLRPLWLRGTASGLPVRTRTCHNRRSTKLMAGGDLRIFSDAFEEEPDGTACEDWRHSVSAMVSAHLNCRIQFCAAFTITLHGEPTDPNGGYSRVQGQCALAVGDAAERRLEPGTPGGALLLGSCPELDDQLGRYQAAVLDVDALRPGPVPGPGCCPDCWRRPPGATRPAPAAPRRRHAGRPSRTGRAERAAP